MKNIIGSIKKAKWFRFKPTSGTFLAFAAGIIVILLSLMMRLFDGTVMNIILRDVLMVFLIGFCLPVAYVRRKEDNDWQVLGWTKKKLRVSLILNIVFAGLLLFSFVSESTDTIVMDRYTFYAISYIMAVGIFEMTFIYGFLRYLFEKAFGIIPAILLTAVFYSFHHAGFQPEFFKLFFVGLMYCSVFYLTRNIFVMFPFFWGVGAVWDVLVQSPAGQALYSETSLIVATGLIIGMVVFLFIDRSLYIRKLKS